MIILKLVQDPALIDLFLLIYTIKKIFIYKKNNRRNVCACIWIFNNITISYVLCHKYFTITNYLYSGILYIRINQNIVRCFLTRTWNQYIYVIRKFVRIWCSSTPHFFYLTLLYLFVFHAEAQCYAKCFHMTLFRDFLVHWNGW